MRKQVWRYFDFWLFGCVVILCVFGLAMIRSAIAGNEGLAKNVTSQTIYVALGLVVILVVAFIDYHYWASLSQLMYLFAILMLVIIYLVGKAHFGAARWIETGLVNIQPAELAKIVMILVLSEYFSKTQDSEHNLFWIIKSFALTAGVVVWILLQPNLSTSIVILVVWFAMLWLSGVPPKYLAYLALVVVLVGVMIFPFLQPYQQGRVLTFLFPDPNARYGDTYNVDQALITIGSGGWFGEGYGHGSQVQLRFLKVRHTDFIFSALAEEFGFVGTVVIIALLVFVIIRCFRAGRLAPDGYGTMICYGFAILMSFQMMVNIGVNLKLMPVTGLTLPFISYGGSSLLSLVLGIGLVESVVMRHQPLEFQD
jgi:rod shape determining protein RodA